MEPLEQDISVALDNGNAEEMYRSKILRTLTVYPEISLSMLHIGIGPSSPSSLWKPVLERMINEGIVKRELKLHDGKTFTAISLVKLAPEPHQLKTT